MGKKRKSKKKAPEGKGNPALNLPIKFEKSPDDEEKEVVGLDNQAIKETPSPKKRKSISDVIREELEDPIESERKRRKLLASSWRERNNIYRSIFGKPSYVTPKDYRQPSEEVPEDFLERQERQEQSRDKDTANPGDPTLEEQHLAVLAYGPDPMRPYWTYVTAGLASPWLQTEAQQVSGFGCELMIKTPEDKAWAPQLLRTLAFYVFNHAGLLHPGVRLSLNAPMSQTEDSELTHAFVWYADEVPNDWYQLPSGGFGLFAVVGITDKELKYADSVEDYGTWCIQEILRYVGHHQITDPSRSCVTQTDGIESALATMKAKADTFRENVPREEQDDDDLSDLLSF